MGHWKGDDYFMKMFINSLLLDKSVGKGLRNAAIACFFTSISLMLPFMITIGLFIEVLKPLTGEAVSWNKSAEIGRASCRERV